MRAKILAITGAGFALAFGAGTVAVHAATAYTAPKDHAQAFITQDQFGTWVAQRQVGFTSIENPFPGEFCFTLPATANPNRSVPVLTVNQAAGNALLAEAMYNSRHDTCPNANQMEVITGYDDGTQPFAHITNESFSIVVP